MKKLKNLNFDPYIVTISRIIAAGLIAAGCLFYWKIGIGTDREERLTAFVFGSLPLIYGVLIALTSIKPDIEKRIRHLNNMIRIPLMFASVSLVAALIFSFFK